MEVERTYRDTTDPNDFTVGDTVGTMAYDGTGRRVGKAITSCADWDKTYSYYHRGNQVVEIRDGSDNTLTQNVWGLTYVDELVQIAHNIDPTSNNNCDHFFYALQDANFNVLRA